MKMRDFSCEELKSLAVELPDEVSRYEAAGDFEGAGKTIDRWLEKPVGEAMKTRLRYEKYIIQELPKEFPDTEEEVIRKFREKLPDFSMEDLQRAERENMAEWILVDGKKRHPQHDSEPHGQGAGDPPSSGSHRRGDGGGSVSAGCDP